MFLFVDGAMGTELLRRAVPPFSCLEALNLEQPGLVTALHGEYRAAGAEILTTNTFGANAFRLAPHGLSAHVREINRSAVRLAQAGAAGGLIAGSVGPSGLHDALPAPDVLRAAYREQARALEEAGVDLFCCETFGDVEEARAAVLGIREVSHRPILLQMTFTEDGRTPLGVSPAQVAAALRDLPLAALGANCCVGAATVERVVKELKAATRLPLVAQPNAGQPHRIDGRLQYPTGPEDFAVAVARLAGVATIVGGCCGTSPRHIAALRRRLNDSEFL